MLNPIINGGSNYDSYSNFDLAPRCVETGRLVADSHRSVTCHRCFVIFFSCCQFAVKKLNLILVSKEVALSSFGTNQKVELGDPGLS